jgi:hypothetical protein
VSEEERTARSDLGWAEVRHVLALVHVEVGMNWQKVWYEVDDAPLHNRFDCRILCHSHALGG